MEKVVYQTDQRFIVTAIKGDRTFRSFLLGHNLSIGTLFTVNFSPRYAKLINITVRQKILSLRTEDFEKIECTRIA